MTDTPTREFLAIITLQHGGGSYFRGSTPEKAAKGAVNRLRKDWNKLYNIPRRKDWNIPVYEVTGINTVYWDDRGVFDEATHAPIALHQRIALVNA